MKKIKIKDNEYNLNICLYYTVTLLLTLFYFDLLYFLLLNLPFNLLNHFVYNAIFALSVGFILMFLDELHLKWSRVLFGCILCLLTALFFGEALHFQTVKTFALWDDIIRVKELAGVLSELGSLIPVSFLLFFIPLFFFFFVIIKKIDIKNKINLISTPYTRKKGWNIFLIIVVVTFSINIKTVYIDKDINKITQKNSKSYIQKYGLLNTAVYNTLKYFVFDKLDDTIDVSKLENAKNEFAFHSNQNIMTAKYKDKNVVFVMGESFAPYGITPEMTPNLYKLREESVNFSEFYSVRPNTFNSEFSVLNSFYLTNQKENGTLLAENTLPSLFKEKGYTSQAFHNFSRTFYNRDEKYLMMGFDAYYGAEDLGIKKGKYIFEGSDADLFKSSFPLYKDKDRFFSYHLTLSTHGSYEKAARMEIQQEGIQEAIARSEANFPELSEPAQIYLATTAITDMGIGQMIADLKTESLLDDTVIIFMGDHYPYMMGDEVITENFGVSGLDYYKVPFFIWENNGEGKTVNTKMSNVDILPTLANLFDLNLQYTMGQDVFSNATDKIILEWYDYRGFSFLTDKGGYDANTEMYYGIVTESTLQAYFERMYTREEYNDLQYKLYN